MCSATAATPGAPTFQGAFFVAAPCVDELTTAGAALANDDSKQ